MKALALLFSFLFLLIGLSSAQEFSDVETGYLTIEKGIVDDTLGSVWISADWISVEWYNDEWYSERGIEVVGQVAFNVAYRFRRWQSLFPEKEVEAIVPFSSGGDASPTVGILVLYRYRTTETGSPTQPGIEGTNGSQTTGQ